MVTLSTVLITPTTSVEAPLSGTLVPTAAHDLPLPASINDPQRDVTYQVVGLAYSGPYLEVHMRISGQIQHIPGGQGGPTWWRLFLVDHSGAYHSPVTGGGPGQVRQLIDETRVYSVTHAGRYQLVVSDQEVGTALPGNPALQTPPGGRRAACGASATIRRWPPPPGAIHPLWNDTRTGQLELFTAAVRVRK